MIVEEIGIKNFRSYGNSEQVLKLNKEKGELILLQGSNGTGKCVEKNTCIDVFIDDLEITPELITFLESTELGRKIFIYIQENNTVLYGKIRKNTKG